ncbi:CoB--CoM heterodisulfide reductase subunit C [Methanosarcina thermophila]|jgi:heterodisulfide reductase subunit C|uniref:CoB--CoM heterodisulfide reductase subunit C n=3 Tax=Methanosarcina thermophila TaxID=2210 RepID=A0A1I6X5Y6_METTE|nr:CoB--CoM heterodisulfide reductase subunit C [Methanosarcina thermophila]ALK04649.1 MAG: disulfide reductase [Methanosarcina sp. 795]AKB13330.1 CoB--CoM heterodisulfide reductase subunit C [Methanosarcina thermophila TM-1]AKB16035.1 CoB--CoM heterodisulfide reductase subunit C [Methanosarcina thermophila CHTI-55]NLU57954.1 CoB--CoM heterodisulfide reductase subunit C [Methanosarcina thermophila]SFT33700.1 CoB--CoM heterodisulfide reductase subunit C [Methanosarcina thermophila]
MSEKLSKVLKAAGLDLLSCMQCGACTGSCPSGRHTGLNTRRILRDARKNRASVLSDDALWLCTTCYTCQERCPRDIPITDALLELRRLAVKEGFMLPEHRRISEMVEECGHAVPLDEETKQKREELGLDPIPETVQKYPEALQEVRSLLKACKFDELTAEK